MVSLLTMSLVTGCSDEDEGLQGKYGYVQFKLYKAESESGTSTRAVTDKLEYLSDAYKIRVVMLQDGVSISQTLRLNSYNKENAEYGLRSDKLQLLTGTYQIVGYYLYDNVDELLFSGSAGDDNTFTIVEGGLQEKSLNASAVARGTVTFKLIKDGLTTRADGEYLFSDIRLIDLTVTNTFSKEVTTFSKLSVDYQEEYVEHQNEDDPDDKYMDVGTAVCDSAVWLPAGTYQVTSYTTYKKSGSLETRLETQVVSGEAFTITDNSLTENAIVPIKLSTTAEYIKDYLALKAIWDALDGKNWSFHGEDTPEGANWNFNKELDMWGDQPGVTLNSDGRVISLALDGFGASGRVPDAIGQLTEIQVLSFGSHNEMLSAANTSLFGANGIKPNMTEEEKQKMRMHYKENFLDYDPRANMSQLLIDGINRNSNMKKVSTKSRIELKDTQIGQKTNNITFVSQAVKRLKNLQQFYIANAPVEAEYVCKDWEDVDSEYAKQYEAEALVWTDMEELTDLELYNCPNLKELPDFVYEIPKLQLLNIACDTGLEMDAVFAHLVGDNGTTAAASVGEIQILYMGYNNLTTFPDNVGNLKKLGLLDCTQNDVKTLKAFGTDVKLSSLMLDYNEIEDIPENFCGFTEQVETLSFTHNKLKYIPNIFDANSVYVMGAVDFSYNEIGSDDGKNFNLASGETYKGINASTLTLSYNQISKFPSEIFKAGSPITTLDMSNNKLTEVPEGAFKEVDGSNYKNSHLLQIVDLRFNKLTDLSDDFRASTLPYLTNMDVSYNCFSSFPLEPLNSSQLQAFGIRNQRDEYGNRTLREWPEGISSCPSMLQLQIGSNDIRKVEETLSYRMYILDIEDNPNISIDVSSVCAYIEAGMYLLFYDKTQDIRGCDALDLE